MRLDDARYRRREEIYRVEMETRIAGDPANRERNPLFRFREARRYTRFTASHLRSTGLTVPTAINFARPRGTPILARSLQLRSLRTARAVSKGKTARRAHTHRSTRVRVGAGSDTRAAYAAVSCKTDVHLPERIIFRGNRRRTVAEEARERSPGRNVGEGGASEKKGRSDETARDGREVKKKGNWESRWTEMEDDLRLHESGPRLRIGVPRGLLTVRKQWSRSGSGCVPPATRSYQNFSLGSRRRQTTAEQEAAKR